MSYYSSIKAINDFIKADGITNTVTNGDIFEVDLAKQTIFPLAHIIVNSVAIGERLVTLNISILLMDFIGQSKSAKINGIDKNSREVDVLNTQLELAKRLIAGLQRGDLQSDGFEIITDANCEPFVERFETNLAGWAVTFDMHESNTMTIC